MSKKSDIVFEDKAAFLTKHPHFVIERHVPAHDVREPNYTAIRAALKKGAQIEGVKLVPIAGPEDVAKESPAGDPSEAATQPPLTAEQHAAAAKGPKVHISQTGETVPSFIRK